MSLNFAKRKESLSSGFLFYKCNYQIFVIIIIIINTLILAFIIYVDHDA